MTKQVRIKKMSEGKKINYVFIYDVKNYFKNKILPSPKKVMFSVLQK